MPTREVTFLPAGKVVQIENGSTLLEAAGKAGIAVNNVCGGDGVCGRCRMILKKGTVTGDSSSILSAEETAAGVILSCISHVESDVTAEIPESTETANRDDLDEDAERFLSDDSPTTNKAGTPTNPLVTKILLQLDKPTLDSNFADFERVERQILKVTGATSATASLDLLKRLPEVLRGGDFTITATIAWRGPIIEIIDAEAGDTTTTGHIAVVDIGTTTIVTRLVRTIDMVTVEKEACFNAQSVYGREVTARIMAAEKKGLNKLQELVITDINRLISEMATRADVALDDIIAIVCAGNTTMIHFLLGLPPENIRRSPFTSVSSAPPPVKATDVGLEIKAEGMLYVLPGIGSWVGGDLTAGIIATGLHKMEDVSMLIDVGTNGEIIVGNRDWLMACSASTGPALEGASVECGMMGETGAIETVTETDDSITFKVIGDCEPRGICGSGIIDLLAVMLRKGIIDRSGRFVADSDSGITEMNGVDRFTLPGTEIFITQDDITNIVTAKAAIFAAAKIMLDRLSISFSDISKLLIGGGFGSFINIDNAIQIGLLPGLPHDRISYAGNTSLLGAAMAASSVEAFRELSSITTMTTYYDLMGSDDYVEQFGQAQFLPHTDISLFATEKCQDNGLTEA